MQSDTASGRLRNTLAFICRIPPELLSDIFGAIVKDSIQNTPYKVGHYRSDLRWIPAVCHICSHWRDVAFNVPSLWSNIPIDFPEWAAEMLRLSKDASLTIIYRDTLYSSSSTQPTKSYTLLAKILSSHARRISHLILDSRAHVKREVLEAARDHGKSLDRFTELFTIMEQPFPVMEHLEVILEESRNYDSIPDAVFNSSSRLKCLVLKECGVTWNPTAFSNVTCLDISQIRGSMNPSASQVLNILSHTPFLETLSISDIPCSSTIDSPEWQRIPPVRLDRLLNMKLSCDFFSAIFLIDRIRFPRDICAIELRLWASPSLDSSGQLIERSKSFVKRLTKRIEEEIEGSISRLELWGTIKAWKSLHSDTLARPSMPPTIDLDIKNHWEFSIELRDAFWQSLRLDHLTTLVVMDIRACFETRTWLIFGNLPRLETIHVYSNEHALIEALSRGMRTNTLAGRPSFACLQNLTIRGWDIYKHAERLSNCLKSRSKAGSDLKLLQLNNCRDVDQDDLACLRGIVKAVEWDGEGGVSDDGDDICWVPQFSI